MSNDTNDFEKRTWRAGDPTNPPADITRTDEYTPMSAEDAEIAAQQTDIGTRAPLMWLIIAYPLQHRGTVLTVQPGQIIGRKGEIHWRDPRMSRRHARFLLIEDNEGKQIYAVEPYQDRNGTYVNGTTIKTVTTINENDRLQMGDTLFVIKTLE